MVLTAPVGERLISLDSGLFRGYGNVLLIAFTKVG